MTDFKDMSNSKRLSIANTSVGSGSIEEDPLSRVLDISCEPLLGKQLSLYVDEILVSAPKPAKTEIVYRQLSRDTRPSRPRHKSLGNALSVRRMATLGTFDHQSAEASRNHSMVAYSHSSLETDKRNSNFEARNSRSENQVPGSLAIAAGIQFQEPVEIKSSKNDAVIKNSNTTYCGKDWNLNREGSKCWNRMMPT